MDLENALKVLMESSRFFKTFNDAETRELLRCCTSRAFKGGETIFKEDSGGTEMYIIVNGSVVVKKEGKTIDIIRSGECFGEMGALSGEKRSASAEASGDVILLAVSESKLGTLDPAIQAKLFKNILLILSERLRERIEENVRMGSQSQDEKPAHTPGS
ncbi:MAG: cyclic nucleotide-binding domain-containing protein [Spirochaetes bacterium]|nr:MAG: cyclic nucleotide-binding domain-containing protein [Spirochaetota bacterium]